MTCRLVLPERVALGLSERRARAEDEYAMVFDELVELIEEPRCSFAAVLGALDACHLALANICAVQVLEAASCQAEYLMVADRVFY